MIGHTRPLTPTEAELLIWVFIVFLLFFVIISVIWAYGDAIIRSKSGCLVALMVLLFFWPVGLILWFVIRPKKYYNEAEELYMQSLTEYPIIFGGVAAFLALLFFICRYFTI